MLTRAIVRSPAPNFSAGLSSSGLGAPDYQRALDQHEAYCAALIQCGLTLTRLEADPDYPDSTFVEDTAILTERCAVLTRPGASSRCGETLNMRRTLAGFYPSLFSIQAPGTLDGGDVCQAENHFFIGLSERTNEAGARQLGELLSSFEYTYSLVDIRNIDSLLHLKSGLAYLGDNRLVLTPALPDTEFRDYEIVRVSSSEACAANCIRINNYVLLPAGYTTFAETVRGLGYQTIELQMSEFQKMDGGLSCLSLRF